MCRYGRFDIWLEINMETFITLRYQDYGFGIDSPQTRFVFRSVAEIRQTPEAFNIKAFDVDIDELCNLVSALLATTS